MSESHDSSANPLSADAEDIRVARLDDVSVTEALDAIMAPLGSLARFIHPAALNLPPEVTANTDGVDPRDIARFFRQVPERPRVLIDLGAEPCTTALLDEVLRRARALGTEISVATTHVSDTVSSCCARHDARLTSATDPIEYDFAIALRRLSARPFCPAVEHASFELWLYDSEPLNLIVAAPDPPPNDLSLLGSLSPVEAPRQGYTAIDLDHLISQPNPLSHAGRSLIGLPTKQRLGRPLRVLGIACTTLQNHGAALLEDGRVVAAVQEERFSRNKQQGWHPKGQRHLTMVNDHTITYEAAMPRASVDFCLRAAGITMDDVDIIAFNGVPARFLPTYSLSAPAVPPKTIRAGRMVYVPHHLTHAASAFRVSGFDDSFVFTVDGRGERESAAFFETQEGALVRTHDLRCEADSLIGGVYEIITTILGFGHHGAGSTMGLAPYGKPTMDLSAFLSAEGFLSHSVHDRGVREAFGHLQRNRGEPLDDVHVNLAASAQAALEDTVLALIAEGLKGREAKHLCLAGGVALNCAMNQRIRQAFGVEALFVQPAANDAGTALGAALEAYWDITGEQGERMEHAYLGPAFSNAEIEAVLTSRGVSYRKPAELPLEVGERLAQGRVVCWFQGAMEYGPRALGARSILADPRSTAMRDRVNRLKARQWWRPFGPSILAGHEAEWFETPMDSRFMLFTLPVRPERREAIAAVCHVDGTTRPQSVHPDTSPRYHAAISHFHALTDVPMVLNTSFNTAHEPIVCTPLEALSTFQALGADDLAIGDFLVSREDLKT